MQPEGVEAGQRTQSSIDFVHYIERGGAEVVQCEH